MNIVTIFLGFTVGATATATTFLSFQTIEIMCMGVVAFGFGTAGGVLLAKLMNLFLKEKINPLIGSAGVFRRPDGGACLPVVGQKENPANFLLMARHGPERGRRHRLPRSPRASSWRSSAKRTKKKEKRGLCPLFSLHIVF